MEESDGEEDPGEEHLVAAALAGGRSSANWPIPPVNWSGPLNQPPRPPAD